MGHMLTISGFLDPIKYRRTEQDVTVAKFNSSCFVSTVIHDLS